MLYKFCFSFIDKLPAFCFSVCKDRLYYMHVSVLKLSDLLIGSVMRNDWQSNCFIEIMVVVHLFQQ